MSLQAAYQTFLAESRELLEQMESDLLQLKSRPEDAELLNALFRSVHTVKGSAGIFGLDQVVAFTHVVENLLDNLRQLTLSLTPALAELLLRCRDHILGLVETASEPPSPARLEAGAALISELERCLSAGTAEPVGGDGPGEAAEAGGDAWHLSVRFGREVLRNGMDPIAFIRYLGSLGQLVHVETLADALPPVEAFDPEDCWLGFEIAFRGDVTRETLEGVFEFVRDDCELSILPPGSPLEAFLQLIAERPEDDERLGRLLVACGSLSEEALERGFARRRAAGAVIAEEPAPEAETDEAAARQRQAPRNRAQASQFIRVQSDKLDRLINLVGELVIASAATELNATASGDSATMEAAAEMSRLVEEIRDSSLQMRMVPIGETFQRFVRIVHDAASELGKDIDLQINGADTELDKTVVEKIGDPLTHLVRNAVDHGIEPAPLRLERGKPARGHLQLNAFHDSGSIVIEVGDDGGGLDCARILAKARERGLVRADQDLSTQEIHQLIFEPGFSTAEQVTNLSGRGVGMDVVRRNIEALRGTVEVQSEPGAGTLFRIRLPLTLAIIDGFLMRVGSESYVVPLELVTECIELSAVQREESCERNYINLRGEVLPFVRLREYFGIDQAAGRRENIVVVQHAGHKVGLLVDALLGEHQTVIKPLGALFRHISGISGSTILGNGRVALILDIPNLIQRLCQREGELAARLEWAQR